MTNSNSPGSVSNTPSVAAGTAFIPPNPRLDSLTSFRTVWLRAIAKVWADGDADGDSPFKRDLLRDAIPTLVRTFPPFQWPWDDSLQLKVKELKKFVWIGDDWVWPTDPKHQEGLKLRVPLKGPANPIDHATALAEYYQARPSLLSDDPQDSPSRVINPESYQFNDTISKFLETASVSPARFTMASPLRNNNFIPSPVSFLDFQVALISIMAKAWENKEFRALVVESGNIARSLNTVRGYAQPWSLDLSIEDSGATWTPNGGGWKDLGKHELLLNLPKAPSVIEQRSIALASYNSTGTEFCFSCCA